MKRISAQQVYWEDRLRNHWGLHGVGSLAYGKQYNSWLYRVRRRAFLGICRRLDIDIRQARVLDLGSGTGFYVGLWQALGAVDITGVDFSATAVMRLQQKYPEVAFHDLDIGESGWPWTDEDFDVVSAFDVLFHVVDDARYDLALRNVAAALKPGGIFLYSDNFLHNGTKGYGNYWKSRSLSDIQSRLENSGFEVVRRVPLFVLMASPVDTDSPFWQRSFDRVMGLVSKSEAFGFLIGAGLYPLELLLRRSMEEGPSTEVMVCRKRRAGGQEAPE